MRTLTDVGARMILARLREAGYTGYLVGGAVRDLLLLRTVEDYDFATSASSAELLALFADARLIGGACGTVDVSIGGAHYQVTPYRREGVYDDHRHPRDVCAAKTMEEDLARRDFTINAMAYDGETLLDPFGGGADLEAKQLRCVGDAAVRFGEDALRVLRLARFSAVLGFSVEEKTAAAAWAAAPSVGLLPAARVRTELQKLLLSPHPDALKVLLDAEGLAAFSLGHTKRDFSLDALPCNMLLRWWGVMQLCDAQRLHVVQSLEFSRRFYADLLALDAFFCSVSPKNLTELKRQLRSPLPEETALVLDAFCSFDASWTVRKALFAELAARGEAYQRSMLAITGGSLMALGLRGSEVGRMLDRLLDAVIEAPALNEPQILAQMARALQRLHF